jgi:nitrite reductase/ring-hydroxylating ferredoxin subunit
MTAAFTRLIEISAVPEGEPRCVKPADCEAIVVYQVDGQFYATQDLCSHSSASLSQGWVEGHEICCPVHDGKFDIRDGSPKAFPAVDPIKTFVVELRDGAVWADLATAARK